MKNSIKILFVEDVLRDAELNWRELEKSGIVFTKLLVETRKDYIEGLRSFKPDIIISDYSLPQFDGMNALLLRKAIAPLTPFIIVTGSVNEEVAVECMKAGADDYVIKEHLTRLPFSVKEALEQSGIQIEKRASELLLKENEEKLQSIFSAAPIGIGLVVNRIFMEMNNTFCIMTGYKRDELIGKNAELIFASGEEYKRVGIEKYGQIAQKGTGSVETSFKCKDGSILNVILSSSPLDRGDLTKGVTFTVLDITDRKLAEEKLKISEERLKLIFDQAPDAYYLNDLNGTFVDGNLACEKLLGYNKNELIGKNFMKLNIFPLKQIPRAAKLLVQNRSGLPTGPDELELKRKDGSKVTVEILTHPIKIKDQILILGLARDVTYRKVAEKKVIHERRMLRTLIDNLPDVIYVKDIDARKVIANKADVLNIGFNKEEEVIGKTDIELFPGQVGQRGYEDDKNVISSGKPLIGNEEDFVDSRGVRRWLLTTKIPLHDTEGKVTGLVGIGHDITERKRTEEELIKAKEKAEEGDRLKTAFLHNISHEIRTPMNAIVGFSTLLGEPDVDPKTTREYIEVIMQSSNHLLAIISDIIDISNIEANLVKIEKNNINVNSLLLSLCDQLLIKASGKKIQLTCNSDVPDSGAYIIADRTKLTQILINLINNAIKFTDHGYVKVGCTLRNNFLEFNITDTGIGISEEYHTKIFDRFYQVQHAVSRLYEGTGLGLAISKANVELIGGKIWLTSEPGKGSSFCFTIPYEKQVVETREADEKRPGEGFVLPVKKTILVAEDVDSNFRLISYFLSATNTEVVRAVNGREAVEIFLSDKNIDFILMDIKMPVMDGYEAARLIREKNPVIPIIAQTAYFDDREKAIESGCSGFISKPFDKKGLLKVLQEFI